MARRDTRREGDTIVALSSGSGRAGVSVIRISGPATRFVFETMTGKVGEPRRARLAAIRDPETGEDLDRGLCLYFPGPNSFTGEDVGEFHVHGSRAVVSAVLQALSTSGRGVRLAQPGEFVRRAFENGRMDLAAIEGLADLIDSETEWQRRQALRQMEGALGRRTAEWREQLVTASAYLEAEIDFSDEGDIGEGWAQRGRAVARAVADEIGAVLASAEAGERIREGFEVVILGPPNAGKSSLLNAIARRDVAIVSEIAGTTRDLIEVRCDIGGMPVNFVDTAGLRESGDAIEQEGVKRALARAQRADLVLVLEAPDCATPEGAEVPCGEVLRVATMADLGARTEGGGIAISAKTGAGMRALLDAVCARLAPQAGGDVALVTRARQREALENARAALERAWQREETELAAEELRRGIRALDMLVGRVDVEDVLDRIFGAFCIGK